MPSSLTMVLPIALVFSTHPPVSVWGTGTITTPERFFLEVLLSYFTQIASSKPGKYVSCGFSYKTFPKFLTGTSRTPLRLIHPVTPLVITHVIVVQEYLPAVHRLRITASP